MRLGLDVRPDGRDLRTGSAGGREDGGRASSHGGELLHHKPTGAVVGQQPFGGGRASGTNDKAGSAQNLQRWVTPRTIKETFVPPRHFGYSFLADDED